jgi:peroxiredoxin
LQALRDALPAINDAGGTLVAISPEPPDSAAVTVARDTIPFAVLSDVGNVVAHQYGIVFTLAESAQPVYEQSGLNLPAWNATDNWELPLAVTYVIDTDGIVRYAFLDADYRNRAEPTDIVRVLKRLQDS